MFVKAFLYSNNHNRSLRLNYSKCSCNSIPEILGLICVHRLYPQAITTLKVPLGLPLLGALIFNRHLHHLLSSFPFYNAWPNLGVDNLQPISVVRRQLYLSVICNHCSWSSISASIILNLPKTISIVRNSIPT